MENDKHISGTILTSHSGWKDTRRWKSTRETAWVFAQSYDTGKHFKADFYSYFIGISKKDKII